MEAKIYKKNYLDTNENIINRLGLLLEDGIDDETYYKRFNDVYELSLNSDNLVEFLNAKRGVIQTYGINSDIRPIHIYNYESDYMDTNISVIGHVDLYNNYDVAYYNEKDIDFDKIYRISELLKLVNEGKIVLLGNTISEEVMDDDAFMDKTNEINPFSEYPFTNLESLDSKTRKLTMKIIHTLVPIERIYNDINLLNSKVKKLTL